MTIQQQLEKLRQLDPKAAEYVETVVVKRYGGIKEMNTTIDLLDHFIWELTPQGHDYWLDLYKRVLDAS